MTNLFEVIHSTDLPAKQLSVANIKMSAINEVRRGLRPDQRDLLRPLDQAIATLQNHRIPSVKGEEDSLNRVVFTDEFFSGSHIESYTDLLARKGVVPNDTGIIDMCFYSMVEMYMTTGHTDQQKAANRRDMTTFINQKRQDLMNNSPTRVLPDKLIIIFQGDSHFSFFKAEKNATPDQIETKIVDSMNTNRLVQKKRTKIARSIAEQILGKRVVGETAINPEGVRPIM